MRAADSRTQGGLRVLARGGGKGTLLPRRDAADGVETVYTLASSRTTARSQTRVSVLCPVATALLGYRGGDALEWRVPGGVRILRTLEVHALAKAGGRCP